MIELESVNITMDFVLLLLAFWMVWAARGLGGVIGRSMGYVKTGAVVLGLAHLSETLFFEVLHIEVALGEFVHRVIILVGFILLTLGLSAASKIIKR